MISLTRAPQLTEDINFGLGLSLVAEAEKVVGTVMLADQHNAETGEITSFEPGSITGYRYLEAIKDSLSKKNASKQQSAPLKIGVSEKTVESETIGKAGIKIAVFSSSPAYIVVLIDSNGITPEFRDKIEEEVKRTYAKIKSSTTSKNTKNETRADIEVGIFTTDTHAINMIRGVLNPLREEAKTIEIIQTGVKEAVADMKEAEFFAEKRWFSINVIGAKQSIELISTVNSIVAISKIMLPLIMLGGLLLIIGIAGRV
jgi:putative membrane protein